MSWNTIETIGKATVGTVFGAAGTFGAGVHATGKVVDTMLKGTASASKAVATGNETVIGKIAGAAAGAGIAVAGSTAAATTGIVGTAASAVAGSAVIGAGALGVAGASAGKVAAELGGSLLRSFIGRDGGKVIQNSALGKAIGNKASNAVGRTLDNMSNPIGMGLWAGEKIARPLGKAMFKINPGKSTWDATKKEFVTESPSIGLTKTGIGLIGGAGIISNAMEASDTMSTHRLGIIDSQATNATPDYSPQTYNQQPPVGSRNDHAGATGDLVFSLFRNRRNSML